MANRGIQDVSLVKCYSLFGSLTSSEHMGEEFWQEDGSQNPARLSFGSGWQAARMGFWRPDQGYVDPMSYGR